MPPKAKFSKEEIIEAAVNIVKSEGSQALTARALGAKLGTSSSPIFTVFQNMNEVQQEVLKSANQLYQDYLEAGIKSKKYPPYKSSGMAYIRFTKEEKELFKLLFMRDRSHEVNEDREALMPIVKIIRDNTGMSEKAAYDFHVEMWIFVHGMATMIVTNYLDLDEAYISKVLTDAYKGLKSQFMKEQE